MGTDIMKHPVCYFIQRVLCFLSIGLGGRKHKELNKRRYLEKSSDILYIIHVLPCLIVYNLIVKTRPFLYIDPHILLTTKLQQYNA